jgi:DMSO/TMAO reductase YedYZ molybdopterin-dependent catalytic subunit
MKNFRQIIRLVIVVIGLLSSAYAQVSLTVELKGLVESPQLLRVSDLQQMKVETRKNVKIVSLSGEVKREIGELKGVLLREILEKAGIKIASPKERGKLYIVVKATDGYTTLFAHNELFNNPTGDNVLLVFEEDKKALEKDGAVVLITTNDKITGPRHVKWVQSIEVKRL